MSIPERRHSRLCVARRPRERDGGGVKDLDSIVAGDLVRSYFKGNRTLSVFAQSDAGNSQDRGLFLNPAGIGKHQARARQELKKIKISERFDQAQAFHLFSPPGQTKLNDRFARARMRRKDHGDARSDLLQRFQNADEGIAIIDV